MCKFFFGLKATQNVLWVGGKDKNLFKLVDYQGKKVIVTSGNRNGIGIIQKGKLASVFPHFFQIQFGGIHAGLWT